MIIYTDTDPNKSYLCKWKRIICKELVKCYYKGKRLPPPQSPLRLVVLLLVSRWDFYSSKLWSVSTLKRLFRRFLMRIPVKRRFQFFTARVSILWNKNINNTQPTWQLQDSFSHKQFCSKTILKVVLFHLTENSYLIATNTIPMLIMHKQLT